MIDIRPASLDDAPEMARVIVDTWFAAHKGQVSSDAIRKRREEWGYAESEQGWRRSIREAEAASAQVLVATDEGRVIAVASSAIVEAGCAEVGALYVDVPYQRSGVGRRLVEAAMEFYRKLGVSTFHIAVLAANWPARQFYESLGGHQSGRRDDTEGQEIVYAWDLTEFERNDG